MLHFSLWNTNEHNNKVSLLHFRLLCELQINNKSNQRLYRKDYFYHCFLFTICSFRYDVKLAILSYQAMLKNSCQNCWIQTRNSLLTCPKRPLTIKQKDILEP